VCVCVCERLNELEIEREKKRERKRERGWSLREAFCYAVLVRGVIIITMTKTKKC